MIGARELQAKLQRVAAAAPKRAGAALYQEGLLIQRTSMKNTPVDHGPLRASHETKKPVVAGRDISVQIVVGGPAAEYAVVVHEDLSVNHSAHDCGGDSKFLEKAVREAQPGLPERLGKRLDIEGLVR